MKEIKALTGNIGLLGKITLFFSLYIFPAFIAACAAIMLLAYIYFSYNYGLLYLALFFVVTVIGRWGVEKLKSRPDWPIFQTKPWLLKTVIIAAWVLGIFHRTLGKLHRIQIRWAIAGAQKWRTLEPKTKVMVATGAAITLIPISFMVTVTTVNEIGKRLPYGKSRFNMSAEALAERKSNRINQAKFAVWGKPESVKNAECMEQYKDLIYAEAVKQGISPERFEGQLFVEGNCQTDLINGKSGAAGFTQILLDVGCEEGLIMDKQFCREVLASGGKIEFIPKNRNIEDRRLNPRYAIPVAAKIIGSNARYWGDENWAFVQYHMGQGNLRNLVMDYLDETVPEWRNQYPKADFKNLYSSDPGRVLPKAIAEANISYDDIFFRVTPDQTPKAFKRLFSLSDSSAWYVYTGLAATEGFALKRNNPSEFKKMVASVMDPDGGYANRPMRAWWSNADAKYNIRSDIAKAVQNGELVAVPNDASFGFVLRTKGGDRIGECDAGNESAYYVTRKATAGLIMLIASRVKEYDDADAFEVTGLIRTNEMYDKPGKNGKPCLPNTQPRTHVIGSAFDIGFNIKGKPKSKATKSALAFVFMDLKADGIIDVIPEGKADHVSYNPLFEKRLEEAYDEAMAGRSPLLVMK